MFPINGYTPQTILNFLRKLKSTTFLGETLFGYRETHSTQAISLGDTTIRARMLPVVGVGEAATPVGHADGTLQSITPPRIRIVNPIDEQVAAVPMAGAPTFDGMNTDPNAALNSRILLEGQNMLDSIESTIEGWAGEVLATGKATMKDAKGVARYKVDYNFTSGAGDTKIIQPALTGDDLWTADASDIQAQLNALKRQIRRHSGYKGKLNVLLGYQAADALRNNTVVSGKLDNRKMANGLLTSMQEGEFIGTLFGFDLFEYDGAAFPSNSNTLTEIWDPTKIAMVPADGRMAGIGIHYGAIFESVDGSGRPESMRLIKTQLYSKMWGEHDPPAIKMLVASCPVPIIQNIQVIRIQKVVA